MSDAHRLLAALSALPNAVTLPLLRALLIIASKPGLSVNELAEELSVPQQTASRHVAMLQGRYQTAIGDDFSVSPLVELEVSTSDPRRRALFLTKRGVATIEKFIRNSRGKNEE